MKQLEDVFHAPIAAARAFLFSRVFLVLVALDAWTLMIGHAGRYGVDGFNVAHFGWLDAIAPAPTAALYVGVLLATGLIALALALAGTRRLALAALFLLYTYSWAMSMLDSYQHHYFVSSVLLCLVFFPELRAREIHPPQLPAATTLASAPSRKKAKQKPAERAARNETTASRGYLAAGWIVIAAFLLIPAGDHRVLLASGCAALLGAATWLYSAQKRPEPLLAQGFGFNLLGVTSGILYTYTSIAKLDAQWRDGHTITRISAAKRVFAPLEQLAGGFGIDANTFWSLFATSVIPIELTIALTYLVSVRADSARSPWPRRIAWVGWLLAMQLHLGAEAMELEIGWFSYYMILFACAFLLPARIVDSLASLLTQPANFVSSQLADIFAPPQAARAAYVTLALMAAVAVMLGAAGTQADLPGALPASMSVAGVLAIAVVVSVARGRALELRSLVLGTGAAAALMWLSLATSEARWDFYRFLGGDLRRRGEPAAALEAYERGERYAPKGQSRREQMEELRRELAK